MKTLYDVPAPAKINLFLHVIGRRADGYHLLQTAFRFIGLYDYLSFDCRSDGVIDRECDGVDGLAAGDDLVVRAAVMLQQATGTQYGARIRYVKAIPPGGGLGGGSSNAATTLIALNRLWGTNLTRAELLVLGARLGADVPIFIWGSAAFAQGTGDELESLSLPPANYVLVQPYASIRTADVFTHPDLTRQTEPVTITIFTDWQGAKASLRAGGQSIYFGCNDLEPVAFALDQGVKSTAVWLGKQGIHARMTGSGSCFFVECGSADQAGLIQHKILGKIQSHESAAQRLIKKTWVCPGLDDHPLKYWIRS